MKRTTPRTDPKTGRPTIANADVPSESAGLPGVGEGAAAESYARDLVGHQAGEDREGGEGGSTSDAREAGA